MFTSTGYGGVDTYALVMGDGTGAVRELLLLQADVDVVVFNVLVKVELADGYEHTDTKDV